MILRQSGCHVPMGQVQNVNQLIRNENVRELTIV